MSEGKQRHRVNRAAVRSFSVGMEYREIDAAGVSMKETAKDTVTITGEAMVFNTPYLVRDSLGEFEETVMPGVCSELLKRGTDTRLLLNHSGMPYARTTAGTLRLSETARALTISADLDVRSQQANDLLVALDRGDISQMSVGMVVKSDRWDKAQHNRTLLSLKELPDVSAVSYPASPTTSIEVLRSAGAEASSYLSTPDIKVQRLIMSADAEYRVGKTISANTAKRLLAAHSALKDAGMGVSAAADHIKSLLTLNGTDDAAIGGAIGGVPNGNGPAISSQDGSGSRSIETVHDFYDSIDAILDDEQLPDSLLAETLAAFRAEERATQNLFDAYYRRHVDMTV